MELAMRSQMADVPTATERTAILMADIFAELRDAMVEKQLARVYYDLIPRLTKMHEDGQIVVLPYKLGKELFWIDKNKKPYEIKKMYLVAMFKGFFLGVKDLSLDDFIFADEAYETHEAADAALKESKNIENS
jgi:hypothetical protein